MASFIFNVDNKKTSKNDIKSTKSKTKSSKKRIYLNYYQAIPEVPMYYTYIDENGIEKKLEDKTYNIFKISSNKTVARKNTVTKIPLEFVPGKNSVKYSKSYFLTDDGNEYTNKVFFNEEENRYYGIDNDIVLSEEKIILYEE